MRFTKVYVELGRTQSVNFQSRTALIGLGVDLIEGEDADGVVKRLQEEIRKLLISTELFKDEVKGKEKEGNW